MAQEIELPDGTIAEFPDGMAQADIETVLKKKFSDRSSSIKSEGSVNPSLGRTLLDQTEQGATFGFGDEVMNALGAAFAKYLPKSLGGRPDLFNDRSVGDVYKEAQDQSKERLQAQFNARPITSIAANIGGGILTGAAGTSTAAGSALANSLRAGSAATRIGKGALAGAASGALYGAGTADEGHRLEGAATGAVLGGGIGGALPATGAALSGLSKGARGAYDRIGALFGSEAASGRIADNIIAKRLIGEGFSPEDVTAAIQQSKQAGLGATLGETTGSSGLLQAEKSIVRGTGKGANTMRDALFNRSRDTVPNVLEGFAQGVKKQAGDVSQAYQAASDEAAKMAFDANMSLQYPAMARSVTLDSVSGLNAGPKAVTRLKTAIGERLGQMGDVNNIEARALTQAQTILSNAEKRGNTFDALLDAKKQLDDLYIEGSDAVSQKNASRYVAGFTRELNDALTKMAPSTYNTARRASMASGAANDLVDAMNSTNEGSLGALYNKFWAKPEMRQDFLRRLPDQATRDKATLLFSQIEKMRRGFGGSDTAFNLPANRDLAIEAGLGIDPNFVNPFTSPQTMAEKLSQVIQPKVYEQLAQQSVNPDLVRIINAMNRNIGVKPRGLLTLARTPAITGAQGGLLSRKP